MSTLPGKTGAWGFVPYGRAQYGSKASDIEPRYETSTPNDGQHNVPLSQSVRFTTYCFSSFVIIPDIRLEISEDNGATFVPLFDGTSFLAPYSGRVCRKDSQRITFYFSKATAWPIQKKIIVKFQGTDEFEQEATKAVPVKWAT